MSRLSSERWKEIQPHLDRALTLGEDERGRFLEALRLEDPALAADLKVLLEDHRELARDGFLGRSPNGIPLEPARQGQLVGPYALLSPIGRGGMGSVWLAQRADGRFDRRVAVKFPSIALMDSAGQERFRREGRLLGRLSHPHIADLVDAGVSDEGQPYLVLEHVDGEPIDRYCDGKKLDIDARLRIFLDVLASVAHAHANLIVHRDLKPGNVLVTRDGQVKLLDFGIAKLLEEGSAAREAPPLTGEGGPMTPQYAAPEQLTGGPITTATDVYALGVLLYELLTGEPPCGRGPHAPAELVRRITRMEPVPPSVAVVSPEGAAGRAAAIAAVRGSTPDRLRRRLRGDLDTIVAKALKKAPAERYASATALADDLRRNLRHEPIAARPDSFAYRTARFVRRNRSVVALTGLAIAATLAGLAGTLIQARTARAERDLAYRQLSRAEAINDLNSFVLSDAAPSGKPFTVTDLLTQAEKVLARQQGLDADRIELLISIGRQFDTMDEDARADKLLDEAYRLSRNLADPSARARASCAYSYVLSRTGEPARADALVQEGLRELPEDPHYALDRIFCLLRGSGVARNNGAAQAGIDRALAAQAALEDSPVRSRMLELRILMDIAESYSQAGQESRACEIFQQAAVRLTELGRDETQTAGTLYNNWGLALNKLGRPLEAEPIYRRAIEVSRDQEGEEAVSPMLILNYAGTLDSLARHDEAADYAERALARAQKNGNEVVTNMSLLQLETIYRKRGELDRAADMLAAVEPRLRQALPPGHYAFANLTSKRSLQALAKGDARAALDFAKEAQQLMEASIKAGGAGAGYLPSHLIRRADVELALGLHDEAAAHASQALKMLEASAGPGTFSSTRGQGYLVLGRAQRGQGKLQEAEDSLRSAVEQLERAVGPEHPDTLKARKLLEGADPSP